MRNANAQTNALHGRVRLDRLRAAWVVSMLLFGTIGSLLTATVSAVFVFVLFTAITLCLGHSLGMHRRLIHQSYECPRVLEYLFVHLGVLVGLAGPFGMMRTHDLRDWAQRQSRCHPYFSHGESWWKDLYWQNLCRIDLSNPPRFEIEASIANDSVYQWMERYWMWQQLPWALLLFTLGGWSWVCWGIASRVSVSIIGHWAVGYLAHNAGERHWHVDGAAVQGYNIPWAALITMGESWHNNHHAFPGSARIGLQDREWDPGWWVLQLLERADLASALKTPVRLSHRPELRPVVVETRLSDQSDADVSASV